jgi:uncharacterized damage-inducible protein DinB
MRTFPDSLIRDIVRGDPVLWLTLTYEQHPFRASSQRVRRHFQSMKKSKKNHATPRGQNRAGTQCSTGRNPGNFTEEMVQAYALNDRVNQLLLERLDPRAWRAQPSGKGARTIAAIFTHVHNVRCKWLRLSAPHLKIPARLDRSGCTQEQAASALAESAARCCEMMSDAFNGSPGRVPTFLRDGWSRPWRPGVAMCSYMISHEAHHRGQVCMLTHQFGFPLPIQATAGMWNWERLGKDLALLRR